MIGQSELEALLREVRLRRPRIIGIDGDLGAGKTTLAGWLSGELRCPCVHLDSFLTRGQASFLPSLQYERLAATLAGLNGPFLIEGICLLAVLERLSLSPDYLVFVAADPSLASRSSLLADEVESYVRSFAPRSRADRILAPERSPMTNSFDVEIAHIRAKTVISILLACGALAQSIGGILLLNSGLSPQGTATLSFLGAPISTSGLGGLILCTAVSWAYVAYRARPRPSSGSRPVLRAADTISDIHDLRSVTQVIGDPGSVTRAPR